MEREPRLKRGEGRSGGPKGHSCRPGRWAGRGQLGERLVDPFSADTRRQQSRAWCVGCPSLGRSTLPDPQRGTGRTSSGPGQPNTRPAVGTKASTPDLLRDSGQLPQPLWSLVGPSIKEEQKPCPGKRKSCDVRKGLGTCEVWALLRSVEAPFPSPLVSVTTSGPSLLGGQRRPAPASCRLSA